MALFGILTLGIYNLVVFIKLLKNFHYLGGENTGYRTKSLLWLFYYLTYMSGVFILAILTIANNESTMTLVIFFLSLLFIVCSGIWLLIREFENIAIISNKYGVVTSESYKYLAPFVSYGSIFTVSIVMQSRLNTLIKLEKENRINFIFNKENS